MAAAQKLQRRGSASCEIDRSFLPRTPLEDEYYDVRATRGRSGARRGGRRPGAEPEAGPGHEGRTRPGGSDGDRDAARTGRARTQLTVQYGACTLYGG